MKRVIIALLASLLSLLLCAACLSVETGEEERVTVDFRAEMTKSAVENDAAINCLDIFIYRSQTGVLESHLRTEGLSASLELPRGVQLEWVVLANAPEGAVPSDYSRMEDNTSASLVMSGKGSGSFERSSSVSLKLSRLMCKVVLEKITPSQGFSCTYMADVAGSCPYLDGPDTSELRYNVNGPEMSLNPFLKECLLSESSSGVEFFCYPDPLGKTALVVETEAPYGVDRYRALLPPLERNTTYIIKELVLESRKQLSFTIEINPWEEVDSSCTLE